MSSHREKMSSVDTAWLRMESPTNLMMISVVLVLDKAPSRDALTRMIEQRLLTFNRFRQKVVHEGNTVYWQDDDLFDLRNHLHYVGLPPANQNESSKNQLQSMVSDLVSTSLDFNKPLWQMILVENFNGGAALVVRIHHCIADGISLVRVLLSLADKERDPSHTKTPPAAKQQQSPDSSPLTQFIRHSLHLGHEALEEGKDFIQHPSHLLEIAKKGIEAADELIKVGAMANDTRSCLKGTLSTRKQTAWIDSLPLEEIKAIGHKTNATVNDVLLAVAAGGLRRFLIQHSEVIEHTHIHVAMPFNLRPLDKPIVELGNQFGLILAALPIGESTVASRLRAVKEETNRIKHSVQAEVFYGMLSAFGAGPEKLERITLDVLSRKASLLMTNVPGPKETLYLAGSKLLQPLVWAPQSGDIGVGISILSYAGTIQFCVVADDQVADPNELVEGFIEEYQLVKEELLNQTHFAEKPFH